jgi:hypothetical protein
VKRTDKESYHTGYCDRRDFLALTTSFCAAFFLPPGLMTRGSASYYEVYGKDLLDEFEGLCKGVQPWLAAACSDKKAMVITAEAKKHFAALLPALPDIGGDQNMDLVFLVKAAQYCAFYRAMKPAGLGVSHTGKMMYDLVTGYYASMPKPQLAAESDRVFSTSYLEELEEWCRWTQKRQYAADWVAAFVKGDGVSFDYGYDMSECAICKYFKAVNAWELQPYFCMADFPRSHALGTGLLRTKALGFDDDCCNFRYKRGRKVTQNWETETKRLSGR